MTVSEAKKLLEDVVGDSSSCKINPIMTRGGFKKIMVDCMNSQGLKHGEDFVIRDIFEKRIYQCVRNQRRPRY